MIYYHGTSSKADIKGTILPPKGHSFGINEEGRTKHSSKVFFTTVKGYAEKYARQCCKRVGGVPVVYVVHSEDPILMVESKGCNIYYDKEVKVLDKYFSKCCNRERKLYNKSFKNEVMKRGVYNV